MEKIVQQGYPDNNPKSLVGNKKVPLHLVPPAASIYMALAFRDGANKYGAYNWRENGIAASVYMSAFLRHMNAWWDGEENASDSGLPHLAHALACLGILADSTEKGNLIDDRPVKGNGAALIEKWQEKFDKDEKYDTMDREETFGPLEELK